MASQKYGGDGFAVPVAVAVMLVVLGAMALFLNVGTYDIAAAAVVFIVVLVMSFPVCQRLARRDSDPTLLWILMGALVAKMVFALARYWMVNKLYGGGGDSNMYDQAGWQFATEVRSGDFTPLVNAAGGEGGTGQIIKLTGYIYSITGRTKFGGFFVYSWMAFWGCVLFARGARWAFPELDHRRYLVLVLFWPSLLFWPSAIGKDAVMVLLLGVATYGACRLLAPKPWLWGILPFAAGLAAMMQIRTHVALMAVLAFAVALTFAFVGGTKVENSRGRGRVVRVLGLSVVVLLAAAAASQTTRFFTDSSGEATSQSEALQMTVERTRQGGSQFEPIVVTNPTQVPAATLSVLFRPFVWEVKGAGMLISSIEGAAIGVLVLMSWKRLRRWPGSAWRRPNLIYSLMYCLLFVVAFSSIANAGILARQRTQMLPFLFVAFAVPTTRWWKAASVSAATAPGRSTVPVGESVHGVGSL